VNTPSELMSDKYTGPSKIIPLGQIRNEDGFRFIGIDKDGGEHYCIVRRGDSNSFYISSNTALFGDLCGWIPDQSMTPNVEHQGLPKAVPLNGPVGRGG
jgi:hypothetical protein